MKPTVVMLCGLLCDARVWQPVADQLQAKGYPCHIFSFAGFDSLTDMAQHVLDHVDGDFALAGHSMGGRVALEVARLAPQRVVKLALLNTGVHPVQDSERPGRQRLLDMADQEGMPAVARTWLPPMMSTRGQSDKALMSSLLAMVESHTPAQFQGQINALLNRPDAQVVLPTLVIPTLLMSGEQDLWSPVAQHADMQAFIADGELVALPDLGHMCIVEDPSAVATPLQRWLEK